MSIQSICLSAGSDALQTAPLVPRGRIYRGAMCCQLARFALLKVTTEKSSRAVTCGHECECKNAHIDARGVGGAIETWVSPYLVRMDFPACG